MEECVFQRALFAIAALALTVASGLPARAESSPDRVVKIVLGVTPGGGLDVLVRGIAQELGTRWGKSVVVENRSGASALIAAEAVARFVFKNLPYNPDTSFANITLLARAEQFLLAKPDVPAKSLRELVAVDRQKAGQLAYGTWGDGSPAQLVYETVDKKTGTSFLGVPYKVKALALAATARSPEFPDVPTTAEVGFAEIQAFIWFGLAVPAGTPSAVVERISRDVPAILKQPAFAERFVTSLGWQLVASTPVEMDATIKGELPVIRDMIANAGVKPQ
jgi:tripartite-type tricarboxylate transporter receptor subunit TctC